MHDKELIKYAFLHHLQTNALVSRREDLGGTSGQD